MTCHPFPNKWYHVGCRKNGRRKAFAGLLVESKQFLPVYTVVARWGLNNMKEVLNHRVEHVVMDNEYDCVSDSTLLWQGFEGGALGNWESKWPVCYSGTPVKTDPRMDLVPPKITRETEPHDTYSADGILDSRVERLMVPTIQRERLSVSFDRSICMPTPEQAFYC